MCRGDSGLHLYQACQRQNYLAGRKKNPCVKHICTPYTRALGGGLGANPPDSALGIQKESAPFIVGIFANSALFPAICFPPPLRMYFIESTSVFFGNIGSSSLLFPLSDT